MKWFLPQRFCFYSSSDILGVLSSTTHRVWVPGAAVILQHHSESALKTESLCKQVLFSLLCWAAVLPQGKCILIINRIYGCPAGFIFCLPQLKLKRGKTTLLWLSHNQTDCFDNFFKNKSSVPWAIWTPTPTVRRKERNLGGNVSLCSLPALELLGRHS